MGSCLRPTLALASAAAAAGCGGGAPETAGWRPLSAVLVTAEQGARAAEVALSDGRTGTLTVEGLAARLEVPLAGRDWGATPLPGVIAVEHPPLPAAPDDTDGPVVLELADGRELEAELPNTVDVEPGTFVAGDGESLLAVRRDARPPADATIVAEVARGEVLDGERRFDGERLSAVGWPLWSGERAAIDGVGAGLLAFEFVIEPFDWLAPSATEPVELVVEAGGERLWSSGALPADRAHLESVRLPLDPRGPTTVEFALAGGPTRAGVLAPRLLPPAGVDDPRPDIVVVQADTLRADGLGAWGSPHGLTPFLDSLAEETLVFERARSSATSTLPAHATLFSGHYPLRAGVAGVASVLPEERRTLPERLREAGYRTGAVTDGVKVSARFGFDQGFEWFSESAGTGLDSTLERVRAFLAADDGRPQFLFVQTYAAHTPYETSEWARERFGAALGLEGEYADLHRRFLELEGASDPERRAERDALLEALEVHYRVGLADMDRGLEAVFSVLREAGLRDGGYLVFTSDHGEAFGEHTFPMHFGPPFEEQVRVPLMLAGPGIDPGRVAHDVSWIDLPPTLLACAGLEAPDDWPGVSLLGRPRPRPRTTFAFQATGFEERGYASVLRGTHKLLLPADPDADGPRAAYDLERDPAERDDRWGKAPWPEALLETTRAELLEAGEPLSVEGAAGMDATTAEQLRRLGYAVGDR